MQAPLPTLSALDGEKALKTVTTVLGQAVIYPSSTRDVLSRTVEQLRGQGYTVSDQGGTSAKLTKDGQSYDLSIVQNDRLGLTTVSLTRAVMTQGPAAAPASTTPASTSTDTTAPADSSAAPATDTDTTDTNSTDTTDAPATGSDTTTPAPTAPTN